MTNVSDMLRSADPLRHESTRSDEERARLRQRVIAAASAPPARSAPWFRNAIAVMATVALLAVGVTMVGSRIWSRGSATLQAAVRFEVRLAEDQPASGLLEVRISPDRVIYLHPDVIVTNSDIAISSVIEGPPSRFGIAVQFNPAGAEKMRRATADHVGRPVAILIDGEVVMAPVLRSPIGSSAVINGDYTKAEAERIVTGIGIR